jgi:hypothetical protein
MLKIIYDWISNFIYFKPIINTQKNCDILQLNNILNEKNKLPPHIIKQILHNTSDTKLKLYKTLTNYSLFVNCLKINQQYIFTSSEYGIVNIFDINNFKNVNTIEIHGSEIILTDKYIITYTNYLNNLQINIHDIKTFKFYKIINFNSTRNVEYNDKFLFIYEQINNKLCILNLETFNYINLQFNENIKFIKTNEKHLFIIFDKFINIYDLKTNKLFKNISHDYDIKLINKIVLYNNELIFNYENKIISFNCETNEEKIIIQINNYFEIIDYFINNKYLFYIIGSVNGGNKNIWVYNCEICEKYKLFEKLWNCSPNCVAITNKYLFFGCRNGVIEIYENNSIVNL